MGVRVRHWKGSWWVFVTYRRRRKAKLVGDRCAAEEIASKLRARLLLGDLSVLEKTREIHTIQTYGERWLETYAAVNCKPRTLELYSFLCRRHLFPALGGVRLTDLTREQARTLLAEKIQGGMKRTTALKIVALLREILNHAVEDRRLASDPAQGVPCVREGATRTPLDSGDRGSLRPLDAGREPKRGGPSRSCNQQQPIRNHRGGTGVGSYSK